MIHILNKQDCCGCASCLQRCPRQCITLREDAEGFSYPVVDNENCIDCGLCEKVCPLIHRAEKIEPTAVLAVKNSNETVRMQSSSGGVFFPLAEQVIRRGGVVFGAVYTADWQVVITAAETLEAVRPMMGSKYVQASTGTAYRDAERFLKAGREVLFSGSPCQVAGLKKFLRREYPNLLAVDFLCHGVPSPGVWRRYLEELSNDLSARRAAAGKNTVLPSLNVLPSIEGIAFREKQPHGWKKYSFVVRGKSAFQADRNSVLLSDIHRKNPYMRGFLSNIYLRPSCYACRCKNGVSHSDLTIGDFWGIDTLMPDFDDDRGVGLVMLSTAKGRDAFTRLDMEVRRSDMATVYPMNGGFWPEAYRSPHRETFFRKFSAGAPVGETVVRLLRVPLWRRALRFAKRVARFFAHGHRGGG